MKKFLVIVLMSIGVTLYAQESVLTNGIYEKKVVVTVDSVKASTLYVRALEALSDWAGSQERSKVNIDVQDKDEGLVVYKGQLYLGYGKANFMCGWETFANFTLKAKCKEGKVQLTVIVPSLTYYWTGNPTEVTVPINEVFPEYNYKGKMLIKKASLAFAPKIPDEFGAVIKTISDKIKNNSDEDF